MKVLVIGGGVMGLACAWRLAGAGAQVELFEGRACGQGATHASLGALWPASPLAIGPLQELHRESLWQFESFARTLADDTGLPVTFRRLGRIELLNSDKAESRAHEEAAFADAHWPDFAAPAPTMQLLSPAEIAREQPDLAPTSHAGLFCRATAQVHIPQLIAALKAACLKAGVLIHEHKPVLGLEEDNGRLAFLRIPQGYVAADAFLVAAGAWTPLLSPLVAHCAGAQHRHAPSHGNSSDGGGAGAGHGVGSTAGNRTHAGVHNGGNGGVTVRPAKGQGIALRPPPGFHLRHILKSGTVYLLPWHFDGNPPDPEPGCEPGDEILVGSTTEPEAGYDETPTDLALHALLNAAHTLFPPLRQATLLRQWTGLRPQNPRKPHPPIMGPHPHLANLYLCTGHYKTGIGLAPKVSALMAECILQSQPPHDLTPFLPANCESADKHHLHD